MTSLFWSIFGMGLALFAAPGPINIETVRRGVSRGFLSAFAVQIGALAAELLWGGAVLAGITPLVQAPGVQAALTLIGAAFLLLVAWQAIREARHTSAPVPPQAGRNSLLVGALYAGSNPLSAMFWLGVLGILTTVGVTAIQPLHAGVICVAYVLGALSWSIPMAILGAWSRRFMRPSFWRWWNALSGVLLGGYGVHLLWMNIARW